MSPEVDTVLAETVFAEIAIVFVIVLVAESWSIFWDNMCFQWHSQLQCRKWRVERMNSSCRCVNVFNMYVKVSEFNAELEHEAQTLLKKENKTQNIFFEKCYRFFFFFSFYRFFSPQLTWEILGNIHVNQIERGSYKLPHVKPPQRTLQVRQDRWRTHLWYSLVFLTLTLSRGRGWAKMGQDGPGKSLANFKRGQCMSVRCTPSAHFWSAGPRHFLVLLQ